MLTLAKPLAELARSAKADVDDVSNRLRAIDRQAAGRARQRQRPLTDTKILAGWNGLMIRGYADAGRVFQEPEYLAAAARAADFVLANLRPATAGCCAAIARGRPKCRPFSTTTRSASPGCWPCTAPTANSRWLDAADALQQDQLARFWDERGGGFFFPSADHEVLIARSKTTVDGVMPSGNSLSAANLIELGRALDEAANIWSAPGRRSPRAPLIERFSAGRAANGRRRGGAGRPESRRRKIGRRCPAECAGKP